MDISKYTIVNIRHGRNPGREHLVYATLKDANGVTIISATLDYIVKRVEEMSLVNCACPPDFTSPRG